MTPAETAKPEDSFQFDVRLLPYGDSVLSAARPLSEALQAAHSWVQQGLVSRGRRYPPALAMQPAARGQQRPRPSLIRRPPRPRARCRPRRSGGGVPPPPLAAASASGAPAARPPAASAPGSRALRQASRPPRLAPPRPPPTPLWRARRPARAPAWD